MRVKGTADIVAGCVISVLLALGCAATDALAQNYALLIGVSEYPGLKPALQLSGPENDVQLMRHVLQDNGFKPADIRVVADKVPGAVALPTRKAILGELWRLSTTVRPGDFVFLQFSGHGSQQPTRPNKRTKETDGLDELFLPRDVGKWDGDLGAVQNALVDEELGNALADLTDRGAFVWAVFDNCHAGNITRGVVPGGIKERKVDATAFGIPQNETAAAAAKGRKSGPALTGHDAGAKSAEMRLFSAAERRPHRGGFVAFYAAQADELAPELRLPLGGREQRTYGLLSYTLAQVITASQGISYRQAGERILQLYAAMNLLRPTTPLFEGSMLDAAIFDQKPRPAVRQWKVVARDKGFAIPAGALHQFSEGAVFVVLPNAAAIESQAIGYLKAARVGVAESALEPEAMGGKRALERSDLPKDAVARLVDPALTFTLRVALPDEKAIRKDDAEAQRVLYRIRAEPPAGVRIDWVSSAQDADVRLRIDDHQLWFLPADGAWVKTGAAKTPSLRLDKKPDQLATAISESLQSIGRALNLARLGAQLASSGFGTRLESHFFITRRKTGAREEVSGAEVPVVYPGDYVELVIKNNNAIPADVTVLAIDSGYGIDLLYPMSEGEENRIGVGGKLEIPGNGAAPIVINDETLGQESLVVIATEGRPESAPANFGFLAQTRLAHTRGAGEAGETEEILAAAGFGQARTRGDPRAALGRTAIRTFHWMAAGRE